MAARAAAQHVHLGQRLRRDVTEQVVRRVERRQHRLGHPVVEKRENAFASVGREMEDRSALDAAHEVQVAEPRDVGGLGRPGGDGAQPRRHQDFGRPVPGRGGGRAVGQQPAEHVALARIRLARRLRRSARTAPSERRSRRRRRGSDRFSLSSRNPESAAPPASLRTAISEFYTAATCARRRRRRQPPAPPHAPAAPLSTDLHRPAHFVERANRDSRVVRERREGAADQNALLLARILKRLRVAADVHHEEVGARRRDAVTGRLEGAAGEVPRLAVERHLARDVRVCGSAAMAAAAASTLTLFGIRNRLIAFSVSAWPTA